MYRFLRSLNFIFVLCAYFVYVSAYSIHTNTLRKCCPPNKLLTREYSVLSTIKYNCTEIEDFMSEEDSYELPDNSEYGIPDCQLQEFLLNEKDLELIPENKTCYDVLLTDQTELSNGSNNTLQQKVVLTCNRTNIQATLSNEPNPNDSRITKCCPIDQVYDAEFHLCRDDHKSENKAEYLRKKLNADNAYIFTPDYELCLEEEYGIELKEEYYTFSYNEHELTIENKTEGSVNVMPKDFWCVDQEYNTRMMVARVCSRNCSEFGTFCVKKCCNVGEYFQENKDSTLCTPTSSILFNITSFTEPLKPEVVLDVIGIRSGLLKCPNGSIDYTLSGKESEVYSLNKDGWLNYFSSSSNEYCMEILNTSSNEIIVNAMVCRLKTDDVDKEVKFVLVTISSVCLVLTLVVYCSMRRNQHGMTFICHVSTMLLAYTCLARTHYGYVESSALCTAIGYGIYFGFVAAFFWLNVMCIDTWLTMRYTRAFKRPKKGCYLPKRFIKFSVYAWGMSLTLTLITFVLDIYDVSPIVDANIGAGYCWFAAPINTEKDWPHYVLFVMPLGVICCVNFILWVLTVVHVVRHRAIVNKMQGGASCDAAKRRLYTLKDKLILPTKLGVLMGVTWIGELISTLLTYPDGSVPPYIFLIDKINELQGLWIFIAFALNPTKIYEFFKNNRGLLRLFRRQNGQDMRDDFSPSTSMEFYSTTETKSK